MIIDGYWLNGVVIRLNTHGEKEMSEDGGFLVMIGWILVRS